MKQYHDLLKDILKNGEKKNDRTSVGTYSVFGRQLRFDLRKGFPAVTTKKLAWRSVVGELLWFLEGGTNERRLAEIIHGTREGVVTIWTPNYLNQAVKLGYTDGELGPVYGKQWRDFGGVDQITNLIHNLKTDPTGRRHMLSAWNPVELDQMALPPCHVLAQFWVSNNNELSCHMYQRSVDCFLGLPFNIASYALLTHLIALHTDYNVGELIISTGDTHCYLNHLDQVREQIERVPFHAPILTIRRKDTIFDYNVDDIKLSNYIHHSALKGPMAV